MRPEDLRRYLKARQCRLLKKRHDGTEIWIKDGLDRPIGFYGLSDLSPDELIRISELLGLPARDLGDWRAKNEGS